MPTGTKIARAAGAAVLLAAAVAVAPATASASEAAMLSHCKTWIDGEWGKASCHNNSGHGRQAWIRVTCVDAWDPDVYNTAYVPNGSTATLTGHCWGAVEIVEAGWR